ncbi:coiled-coil domain-containing protein 27 isoform X2 [Cygnus olor]|uniref:coiled-coil domain-containing protein 27 isoform X2 n=1 Tax=Cygnus olor TaxID=8869 RepID=UPI001ADE2E14|nr:coiled-coil domain-containing protein 27 isoform X2 [Cygnus olor]
MAAPAAEAEGGAGHGGAGAAEAGPGSSMGSPVGSPRRRDGAAEPPWPWGEERDPPWPPLARCPGTSHRATSPSPPGGRRDGPAPPGDPKMEQDRRETSVGAGPGPAPCGGDPRCASTVGEKEQCLTTLREEVEHLSKYKAECAQKDVVISDLLKETESLKKELELLRGGGDAEPYGGMEQRSSSEEAAEEAAEEALSDTSAPGLEQAEGEEETLIAQLIAFQDANEELCAELQNAHDDYNIATGVMCSLQRQLEIQESQLRKTESEKERLEKELRERESQLQAMSAKFCSLREEGKHEEMMVTTEKENCSLRQVVTEQESKLAEQNKLISDLQGTVSQLEAEALTNRYQIHKQQRAQEEMQSQAETLQHTELQTRVALECLTSRFERFRSKIIQATFGTAGSKPPQAELTDEEVLEAMQKIISERIEFHQMLKQKGVRVPSLYNIDTATSSPTNSKGRRKSPAR